MLTTPITSMAQTGAPNDLVTESKGAHVGRSWAHEGTLWAFREG